MNNFVIVCLLLGVYNLIVYIKYRHVLNLVSLGLTLTAALTSLHL